MSAETLQAVAKVAFCLLGAALVAVIFLPPVFTALGLSRVTCTHLQPIPDVWDRDFPIHPHLYDQLHEYGFVLLGGIRLRYWLWFHFWCWPRRYRVFGDRWSFVLVSRSVFRKRDEIALLTLYTDGAWVWTANYPWLPPLSRKNHTSDTLEIDPRWSMGYQISRLLGKHRGAAARLHTADRQIIQHDYLPVVVDSHRNWAWRRTFEDRFREWRDALFMTIFSVWLAVVLRALYLTGGTGGSHLHVNLGIVCSLWLLAPFFLWGGWCEARSAGILGWLRRDGARKLGARSDEDNQKVLDDAPPKLDPQSSQAIRPRKLAADRDNGGSFP